MRHSKGLLQNQSELILEKNRVISSLKESIEAYFGKGALESEEVKYVLEDKILTKADWEKFKINFSFVYPDFIGSL